MNEIKRDEIRQAVRDHYGQVAERDGGCGCSTACCGTPDTSPTATAAALSQALGYSADETDAVPEGANMGLGCGNPHAIAGLKPGETVLDLGSGGGFDAFLAARQVGGTVHHPGVDMTPAMLTKASTSMRSKGGYGGEFWLGEIENLPAADRSVGVLHHFKLRDQSVAGQAARVP